MPRLLDPDTRWRSCGMTEPRTPSRAPHHVFAVRRTLHTPRFAVRRTLYAPRYAARRRCTRPDTPYAVRFTPHA